MLKTFNQIGSRAKLRRLVEQLAVYNDKGRFWSNHDEDQIAARRSELRAKATELIAKIGDEKLPDEFIAGIKSGDLWIDSEGRYVDLLKSQ